MTTLSAAARFGAASLAAMVLAGLLLALPFSTPAARRAIWISGTIAFAVQLATFALARRAAPSNVIAGWGAGALIRLAVLIVYAMVLVNRLALPETAALVSLATFLFLSTLIEPLYLGT